MSSLLDVDDVKVHFGGVKAVDGVTLRLEPGLLYGLVGPNGSGKTTLVNAITRLTRATSGRIVFLGEDVTRNRPHQTARLGMARTFQGIRLLPTISVKENILLGADHLGSTRATAADVDAMLTRLGLAEYADHDPTSLSYGTQRRVEIARALLGSPKLLLLDEPVAGMNRSERNEIGELIASLKADGTTVLLIEHDLRMIQELCDHMFVLNFGRCIASGPPRETASLPSVQEAYLGRAHVNA